MNVDLNGPRVTCNVDGCSRSSGYRDGGKRGFCRMHYLRWYRYGDPHVTKVNMQPRGTARAFIEAAIAGDTSACVLWPFSTRRGSTSQSRYGKLQIEKRTRQAHRYVCEMAHGPAPNPGMDAAHLCGVSLCINWRHLTWATKKENHRHRLFHGTEGRGEKHPRARLRESDIRAIREMATTGKSRRAIAQQFGVTEEHANLIIRRGAWKHVA